MSLNALGRTVSVTGPVTILTGLLESVAVTVRIAVPAAVGIPPIEQPEPSVNPAGNVPLTITQV